MLVVVVITMACDGICCQSNVNGSIGALLEAGCRHQKGRTSKLLMRKYLEY